jgi:hypothetical protein
VHLSSDNLQKYPVLCDRLFVVPVGCPVCCALAFNNVEATTKGGKLELNLVGYSSIEVQHDNNGIKKQILMAQFEQGKRVEKLSIGPDGGRFIKGSS